VGASLLWAQRKRPHGSTSAEAPTVTTPVTGVAPVPAARRGGGLRALRITAATIGVLIVLAVAAAIAAVAPHLHLRDGIGTRSYEPATLSTLRPEYRLGVGKLVLDLSKLNLAKRSPRTAIDARLGIGHLVIRVPRGVTVTARSRVVWGDSHLLGHDESGHDLTVDVGAARGQLVLDTHVGIGQVDVERAGQ
jgi:hypothetical protein